MKKYLFLCALALPFAPLALARADTQATPETKALFDLLVEWTDAEAALWGHQYAIFRGVAPNKSGWLNEHGPIIYSDSKNITGVHPAVTGWDFNEIWNPANFARQAIAAHELGIINTFSHHMKNPVTGGNYADTNLDLKDVLPGGSSHDALRAEWDIAADFLKRLVDAEGNAIPVIIRPYHEMTGGWFWWGSRRPATDYVALWRWTVEYLRDTHGLHNLLWLYSPDKVRDQAHFLERWPGDDFVDIVGLDYYRSSPGGNAAFVDDVRILAAVARAKNLPAALSEIGVQANTVFITESINPFTGATIVTETEHFGLGGMSDADWWLNAVHSPLAENNLFSEIAFIAGWANWSMGQYHVPTAADKSAPGFRSFVRTPEIRMLDALNPNAAWTNFAGIGWLFTPDYPWVFHPQHGWLYMAHDFFAANFNFSHTPQWYYDPLLGWIYTTATLYPHLWTVAHDWLYFTQVLPDGQRQFYRFSDEALVTFLE